MDLIKSSLTLQANLFQLFHPIGGVNATPLSHARVSLASKSMPTAAVSRNIVRRYIARTLIRNFLRTYSTSTAKSESLRPQTTPPMRRMPRLLQMRSTMRRPADSKENLPPRSRQPWFQTPYRAALAASSRRPPNPPAPPRSLCTNRPTQKFRPTATTNVFRCKAAAPSPPPTRIRRTTPAAGSAHDRSATRLRRPTPRRKHCAGCTRSPPDSQPWALHIPRPAFWLHTISTAYAKNLPLRKLPRPAKIAGIPRAARAIPAKMTSFLFSRLSVRAPAPRNTEPQSFQAATSREKLSGKNGWSPAESTAPSTAQGSRRACPSNAPGQMRGHTPQLAHPRPAKLFSPATARRAPATPRNAPAERESRA